MSNFADDCREAFSFLQGRGSDVSDEELLFWTVKIRKAAIAANQKTGTLPDMVARGMVSDLKVAIGNGASQKHKAASEGKAKIRKLPGSNPELLAEKEHQKNLVREKQQPLNNAIGIAIKELLKAGKNNERIEFFKYQIGALLIANSELVETVSAEIKMRYKADFELVLSGIEIADKTNVQQIKVELIAAIEKYIAEIEESVAQYRAKELEAALNFFEEWAKSIPVGGSNDLELRDWAKEVRYTLKSFLIWKKRFKITRQRNVFEIAQSIIERHKGAIAAKWLFSQPTNYHIEPDAEDKHKEYVGKVFVVRGNKMLELGLMQLAGHQYTDEVLMPGLDGCCCRWSYIYDVRSLPEEMKTEAWNAKTSKVENRIKKITLQAENMTANNEESFYVRWWKSLRG